MQASVAPLLRASELTTGILKTRSAPSGRRKRWAWSCTASIVISPSSGHRAGVVGDHQRAALGGDVLQAAHLEAEPLLRDRAQRRHEEALGQLAVEAVVVDLVVALEPAAHERHQLGEAALPVVAEDLLAAPWSGGEPVADGDAGPGRRSSVVAAGRGRPRAAPSAGRPRPRAGAGCFGWRGASSPGAAFFAAAGRPSARRARGCARPTTGGRCPSRGPGGRRCRSG